jgi:hypothetical protein
MQPYYEPTVGDIVVVEREYRWGDRIPNTYRHYVTFRTYLFRAQVVRVCPSKPYHRVVPLPWHPWESGVRSIHSRKAYRTQLFRIVDT